MQKLKYTLLYLLLINISFADSHFFNPPAPQAQNNGFFVISNQSKHAVFISIHRENGSNRCTPLEASTSIVVPIAAFPDVASVGHSFLPACKNETKTEFESNKLIYCSISSGPLGPNCAIYGGIS